MSRGKGKGWRERSKSSVPISNFCIEAFRWCEIKLVTSNLIWDDSRRGIYIFRNAFSRVFHMANSNCPIFFCCYFDSIRGGIWILNIFYHAEWANFLLF